ncbi:Imidazolonepropionase [Pleurostoma richardsiae]|uniref:Imidazolonepropionase n=1 Tax=Pleurostoma richardsiae TaxID=41990 RepID=A0AA38VVD0_9PEZI|nr:Imidazolonepropionase [Pleurostoma richardsiae]
MASLMRAKEKEELLPPPYHEAAAYPRVRTRRLRRIFSLPVGLAVALTLAVSWLCFLVERDTQGHHTTRNNDATLLASLRTFEAGLAKCAALRHTPARTEASSRTSNPRWNPVSGQDRTVVLRNATLFDGEIFVPEPVDIVFSRGLVASVTPASEEAEAPEGAKVHDLGGRHVSPGLVDMHSHHLLATWPGVEPTTEDGNEMHDKYGPLTPFARALEGMKPYDGATRLIAAGGVTSSLIIPGSANIMGGEGAPVKNAVRPGRNGEFVVEEMLLEHGVPEGERRRYMKMACGENPKRVYGHTRMGNAWELRSWLARAKELLERQDAWCEAAQGLRTTEEKARLVARAAGGGFPEELELESTVGMLRGRVAMHNHCYEPEDMETMLRISHEFGFRVRAFHHALSAWQVPEMIKEYGENITIATFAEFSLYKVEGYQTSLSAGKILNDHGVPVAYKSDHSEEQTNAQYLLLQAAVGHSFHLPADKAMQAVTSIPAAAIDLDDRIGYVRPGYDADIVVWDAHPLSIGATPRQVFIDGVATLDPLVVEESSATMSKAFSATERGAEKPAMRAVVPESQRQSVCESAKVAGKKLVISGIRKSFLDNDSDLPEGATQYGGNHTITLEDGVITCLGDYAKCGQSSLEEASGEVVHIALSNGHISPGLTAVTAQLGLAEIATEPSTGDGIISPKLDPKKAENVDFAKYGVTIEGKGFARARLGGVTRAITAPMTAGGLVRGVSVGVRTGVDSNLLNGGVFQPNVALHVAIGEEDTVSEGAISLAVQTLRSILTTHGMEENDTVYGLTAAGGLPLVVHAQSKHDVQQVILLKRDYPDVKIVLQGGHAAPHFARELAKANIPVILSAFRPGPQSWYEKDALPGPPLSRSPASILSEAGVLYAIAIDGEALGDYRIHDLALEASWAAKYAGLTEHQAVRLVSKNVEDILGLRPSRDIVVWEGNPLQFGTPVLAFQEGLQEGKLELNACWPDEQDE